MLICEFCGHTVMEHELPTYTDCHGWTDVLPILETRVDYCCHECGRGDYKEATVCKVCGTPFYAEDKVSICENCLEEAETLENAIKLGSENTENVEVNGFFLNLFGAKKINEILERAATSAEHTAVSPYLYANKEFFADLIMEQRENA